MKFGQIPANRLFQVTVIVSVLFYCILCGSPAMADDENWPQFQRDAVNNGITASCAPLEMPREEWKAFTHYRGTHGIDATPIAADGKVFIIDVEGYAWAFDADNGSVIWSTGLENDIRYKLATPAWGEDKVFFATDAGYIYALDDETGAVLWSGKLTEGINQEAELNTQVLYESGKLYVGSWEGKYYCLDASGNGNLPLVDWTYEVADTRYDWYSSAAVIGDYVLFGNTDGLLNCLDKSTGTLVASCDLSTEYGITAGSIRSGISTNASRDRVYLTSKKGYVYAIGFDAALGQFDTASGWFTDIDDYSTSTPVVCGDCLYVCSGGSFSGQQGGVYCFEAATGNQTWFNDLGVTYGSQASPAISIQDGNPYIYISTGAPESAVVCLDAAGSMLWEYVPSETEYALQGVAVYAGRVFFGNDAGYLFALSEKSVYDITGDGEVDIFDMITVGNAFGAAGTPGWIIEDANSDGVIDIFDMITIGNHFGD